MDHVDCLSRAADRLSASSVNLRPDCHSCGFERGLALRWAPALGRADRAHATVVVLLVIAAFAVLGVTVDLASAEQPTLAVCQQNPRYLEFRGRPTILISSGEHYGAVLNLDFDFVRYLDSLNQDGLNHTRLWLGTYREIPGAFNIVENTLAPAPHRYVCPWARSDTPGYSAGGNKFDLSQWDAAFFARLHHFLQLAAERGIVVELNLFCPNYEDSLWQASPMHHANNVNQVGNCPKDETYTLLHPDLLAVQLAVVRKAVIECNRYDNLYYEICNEPYFAGVTMEWQHRIVDEIVATERDLPRRHLISLNIANGREKVTEPHPHVSLFNFHYCHPPDVLAMNADLGKPIGENETGFRGADDFLYRSEGWDFILAGGALYNNLDYSFTVARPDGSSAEFQAPGGGGPALRRQLRYLKEFIHAFDFVRMRPANELCVGELPEGATRQLLAEPGEQYAAYLKGAGLESLLLDMPAGTYRSRVLNPVTGETMSDEEWVHQGGTRAVPLPAGLPDLAVGIRRVGTEDAVEPR